MDSILEESMFPLYSFGPKISEKVQLCLLIDDLYADWFGIDFMEDSEGGANLEGDGYFLIVLNEGKVGGAKNEICELSVK